MTDTPAGTLLRDDVDGLWARTSDGRWVRMIALAGTQTVEQPVGRVVYRPGVEAEKRVEWGVRLDHSTTVYSPDEKAARFALATYRPTGYPDAVLVSRTVHVGPWVEVPS